MEQIVRNEETATFSIPKVRDKYFCGRVFQMVQATPNTLRLPGEEERRLDLWQNCATKSGRSSAPLEVYSSNLIGLNSKNTSEMASVKSGNY